MSRWETIQELESLEIRQKDPVVWGGDESLVEKKVIDFREERVQVMNEWMSEWVNEMNV